MSLAGNFATARRGGLTGYEADFVRAKTSAGVPLSAVSRMLGRNIECLRDHAVEVQLRGVTYVKPKPADPVEFFETIPKPVRKIISRTAELCGIPETEIVGPNRNKLVTIARQHVMYELRRIKGSGGGPLYSFLEIGRFLNRDHTTVMHGVDAHASRNGLDAPA